MSILTIKFNEEQLEEVKQLYQKLGKNADVCIMRVINNTIGGTTGRGGMVHEIKKILQNKINLTKDFIEKGYFGKFGALHKGTITIEKAQWGKLTGIIFISGAEIPLIHYSNKRSELTGKDIRVQVLKSRGAVKMRHAFVPKLKSGYRGLFEEQRPRVKTSGNKWRIKEMYGPGIPKLFVRDDIYGSAVKPEIEKMLKENLEEQVDKYLSDSAGKQKHFS